MQYFLYSCQCSDKLGGVASYAAGIDIRSKTPNMRAELQDFLQRSVLVLKVLDVRRKRFLQIRES